MRFVVVLLILIATAASHAQGGKAVCDDNRENRALEERFDLEVRMPAFGTQLAPFSYSTKYGDINLGELFRGASGYYCDTLGNWPTIYASHSELIVVGPNYERTFPLKDFASAIGAYKKLLRSTGRLK